MPWQEVQDTFTSYTKADIDTIIVKYPLPFAIDDTLDNYLSKHNELSFDGKDLVVPQDFIDKGINYIYSIVIYVNNGTSYDVAQNLAYHIEYDGAVLKYLTITWPCAATTKFKLCMTYTQE